jgi:hypothetical protein
MRSTKLILAAALLALASTPALAHESSQGRPGPQQHRADVQRGSYHGPDFHGRRDYRHAQRHMRPHYRPVVYAPYAYAPFPAMAPALVHVVIR